MTKNTVNETERMVVTRVFDGPRRDAQDSRRRKAVRLTRGAVDIVAWAVALFEGAERKSSWLQQASRRIFARSSPHGSRGQTWACSLGLKSSLFGT